MRQLDKPNFSNIDLKQFEQQLEYLLKQAKISITKSVEEPDPTWQNTLMKLEEEDANISILFSPVSHLNGVKNSDELRSVYEHAIQKLSLFYAQVGQNRKLFALTQKVAQSDQSLNVSQQKAIELSLRDFKLSGVDLSDVDKARLTQIEQSLARLQNSFSHNVLDCTDAFEYLVKDDTMLLGLPNQVIHAAKSRAESGGKKGFAFGLDFPTYAAIISYAENREIREKFYTAYVTRASDQGPHDAKYDNQSLMDSILQLRHEKARLLGFNHFAEFSIASKMAKSTADVINFLEELAEKSQPYAKKELEELQSFAKETGFEGDLQAWDYPFYTEKYQQTHFQIDQEKIRAYFPTKQVQQGLFDLIYRLFEVEFKPAEADLWHEDVAFFELYQADTLMGGMYIDLYARAKKRGGAWMDDCRCRRMKSDGTLQLPVAYLTCNFRAPNQSLPATLTHDDVVTFFHEMGHCLQHLLTQVDVLGVSGINGVSWDAVELPSQFLENFAWEKEVIDMISAHIQTGETVPDETFTQMRKLKKFQAGIQMLRQLEFALFDFKLHMNDSPERPHSIQSVLDKVRSAVSIVKTPTFNRFQHGFSHIFAGGYAAGYYSYKWAEVLSADAYSKFEKEGILNPVIGKRFRDTVLGLGGSMDAMDVFVKFRGREPTVDSLLSSLGLD